MIWLFSKESHSRTEWPWSMLCVFCDDASRQRGCSWVCDRELVRNWWRTLPVSTNLKLNPWKNYLAHPCVWFSDVSTCKMGRTRQPRSITKFHTNRVLWQMQTGSPRLHPMCNKIFLWMKRPSRAVWQPEKDSNPHYIAPTSQFYRCDMALPLYYPAFSRGGSPKKR